VWRFADLLNEFRSCRPINSVIITFDIVELIRMSNEQRISVAMNIHARLVDVAERLRTQFYCLCCRDKARPATAIRIFIPGLQRG